MSFYDNMLPEKPLDGHRGYYPVCNKEEWEQLPDLYKVMEWDVVLDPFDKGRARAIKSVVFDVTYMEPYGINARVAVHPSDVQKILFCSFERPECHLYSICEVELEGGIRLPAHWLQDSQTGAFGIYVRDYRGEELVGRQGGFYGYIPERIAVLEDGTFKYDYQYNTGKRHYYTLGNPFKSLCYKRETNNLEDVIKSCEEMNKGNGTRSGRELNTNKER